MNDLQSFGALVALMDRLREPGGCPWDREQDFQTLRAYLLEEAYEVAEALDRSEAASLREELGDLLFQIVFLARIAKEQRSFTIDDVITGIHDKMVRRHPHVFGSATAETADEVLRNWEQIKRDEKSTGGGPGSSLLDGIPTALPALLKAQRLGVKAARVGFDWAEPLDVLDKVQEELEELRQAVVQDDRAAAREELGDLLFALVMVARRLEIDPEGALDGANIKFRRRFAHVEAELQRQGMSPEKAGRERLESLWQQAKDAEPERT